MSLPIIVLGAGGHARVVIDALRAAKRRIVGVVDPKVKDGPFGIPALGGDEALDRHAPGEVELANGIGGTGATGPRDEVFRRFGARGYRFVTIVHPSAVVSEFAELGEGAQVMAGGVVQPGAAIGANTIVNTRASVDHDCKIGRSVHIAPGVTLSGTVTVGDGSHIGTGACVIHGINIGRGCLVAAGAVVYRDLADGQRLVKAG